MYSWGKTYCLNLGILFSQICQIGRVRTYPEENHPLRDTIIKEMILRRGCDTDAGNVPETLVPSSIRQMSCHGISKQCVEEEDSIEPRPSKSFKQIYNHIHGNEHPQHSLTSAIADSCLCNGETFDTQTPVTGCNSNVCPGPQVSASTFQPRPSKEPMRNCTALDRSLKDLIVNTVARQLLGVPLKTDEVASTNSASGADSSGTCSWKSGGNSEHTILLNHFVIYHHQMSFTISIPLSHVMLCHVVLICVCIEV